MLGIRERLHLSADQLAARSGLSAAEIAEIESGSAPPDWRVVDALVAELRASGDPTRAEQLIAMRSCLEAPLHGSPGSYCACTGTTLREWHWVRRGRGQIYCAEHGIFLIPACYSCGYRYSELAAPALWCPGCNMPIEGMINNLDAFYLEEFAQDENETLAAARSTWTAQTDNAEVIRRTTPMTPQDTIAAHNRAREITVQGLSGRAQEHYLAARSISKKLAGAAFSRHELIAVYLDLVPGKFASTVLPSDYCLHANMHAADNPWFLLREQRGRYRFVGIDGHGDQDIELQPTTVCPRATLE